MHGMVAFSALTAHKPPVRNRELVTGQIIARNARSGFRRRSILSPKNSLPRYQQFDKETPNGYPKGYKLSVRNISYVYIHQLGPTLYLLFGAVALLLAIGCGNVSILLLARGTAP